MSGPTRRMGSIDSEMGIAMLSAAAEILRDEGHAALSSRRIAECLGVKQRLVYYYFSTMDQLVLETFKRLSRLELDRLRKALESGHPLQKIWEICINSVDARLVSEFMVIANRNDTVRAEVIHFIRESRRIQVEMVANTLSRDDRDVAALSPDVIAFMGTSIALALNRETALGVDEGHAAILELIEKFIISVEP